MLQNVAYQFFIGSEISEVIFTFFFNWTTHFFFHRESEEY